MKRIFTKHLGFETGEIPLLADTSERQEWGTEDFFLAQEPIWVVGFNIRADIQPADLPAGTTFEIVQLSVNLTQGGPGPQDVEFAHAWVQLNRKCVNGAVTGFMHSPKLENEHFCMFPEGHGIPIREEGTVCLNADWYLWSTLAHTFGNLMGWANIYYIKTGK